MRWRARTGWWRCSRQRISSWSSTPPRNGRPPPGTYRAVRTGNWRRCEWKTSRQVRCRRCCVRSLSVLEEDGYRVLMQLPDFRLIAARLAALLPGARPVQAGLTRAEEGEDPLDQEGGGVRVVGRQRAVGEVVLVAGVQEQLCVLGLLDELAGGVNVAFADEDRVAIHPVHLHWPPVGPGGAERRDRDAGIEEQRPLRARPRLRQLLGREHPEREAGVHQPGGQSFDGLVTAPDHLVGEADLLGMTHPLLQGAEGAAIEQVGRVDGVPGTAQLVGEGDHAGG